MDMEDLKQDKSDGEKKEKKKGRESLTHFIKSFVSNPWDKCIQYPQSLMPMLFFIFTLYLQRRVHSWMLVFVCG